MQSYGCDVCDWGYDETSPTIFYFDCEKKTVMEEPLLKLSHIRMAKSPINGYIENKYCNNCDEFFKIYCIDEDETKISLDEAEKLILNNKNLRYCFYDNKEYSDNFKKIILSKKSYEALNGNIKCPICGKDIKLLSFGSKCPNCEKGKLNKIGFIGMVD